MKRVEVTVRDEDAALLRQIASALRRRKTKGRHLRGALRAAIGEHTNPSLAEVLKSGPDVSGPEFDAVFEEIERFRHDPAMMKIRDVDL
ncbi:MAG: hypothetical protein JO134_20620 [Xanthobacteraceae bacterium]|nr:hypothetical protein [Xanthobacteraceae bacterium]